MLYQGYLLRCTKKKYSNYIVFRCFGNVKTDRTVDEYTEFLSLLIIHVAKGLLRRNHRSQIISGHCFVLFCGRPLTLFCLFMGFSEYNVSFSFHHFCLSLLSVRLVCFFFSVRNFYNMFFIVHVFFFCELFIK